jgi:hypothetical protein
MQNKKFKAAALLVTFILMVSLLSGCGGAATMARPSADPSKIVKVTGSCTMTIENKKATIQCTTDMIDGVKIRLSVENPQGKQLAFSDIVKMGDNLKAEFDLSAFNETAYFGFALCAPELTGEQASYGKQSDAVFEKYGKKFENIDSANVMWTTDHVFVLFASGEKKVQ